MCSPSVSGSRVSNHALTTAILFVCDLCAISPRGYARCSTLLATGDPSTSRLVRRGGCAIGCSETAAMAAASATSDIAVSTSGRSTATAGTAVQYPCRAGGGMGDAFAANDFRDVQYFPCALCEQFPDRVPCGAEFDVPVACAGDAGRACPLFFMFHGSGGNIGNYKVSIGREIHNTVTDRETAAKPS